MKKKNKGYQIAPGITCYGFKPKGYTMKKIKRVVISIIFVLMLLSIPVAAFTYLASKIF